MNSQRVSYVFRLVMLHSSCISQEKKKVWRCKNVSPKRDAFFWPQFDGLVEKYEADRMAFMELQNLILQRAFYLQEFSALTSGWSELSCTLAVLEISRGARKRKWKNSTQGTCAPEEATRSSFPLFHGGRGYLYNKRQIGAKPGSYSAEPHFRTLGTRELREWQLL